METGPLGRWSLLARYGKESHELVVTYAGNTEVTLRGHDRKHFVVVPLDGPFRVKDMAPSIQVLKKAAAASDGAVGVGLLSMMGFEHTRNELSVS